MNSREEQLPKWFVRPEPEVLSQLLLFRESPDSILAHLRVSTDDLERWRSNGWISLNVADLYSFETPAAHEVQFVRDVVRSGLSDSQIRCLLEPLPRPFAFDPARVAYSFSLGWVAAVPPEREVESVAEADFDHWLQTLADSGETAKLEEIRESISELLPRARDLARAGDEEHPAPNP